MGICKWVHVCRKRGMCIYFKYTYLYTSMCICKYISTCVCASVWQIFCTHVRYVLNYWSNSILYVNFINLCMGVCVCVNTYKHMCTYMQTHASICCCMSEVGFCFGQAVHYVLAPNTCICLYVCMCMCEKFAYKKIILYMYVLIIYMHVCGYVNISHIYILKSRFFVLLESPASTLSLPHGSSSADTQTHARMYVYICKYVHMYIKFCAFAALFGPQSSWVQIKA